RPDDDGFKVVVPLFGDGLPGEIVTVELHATRIEDKDQRSLEFVKDATGKIIRKLTPPTLKVGETKVKFSGGEFPAAEAEFTVDLAKKLGIDPKKDTEGLLQGKWLFV